jgi:ATP synthase protein I
MNPDAEERRADQRRLEERVGQQVRRLKQAQKDRRTLLGYSAYLGTLGVLFILPVVVGAYLGRWIDGLFEGYSVRWTVSLIVLGIVVGALNAYLFIRE